MSLRRRLGAAVRRLRGGAPAAQPKSAEEAWAASIDGEVAFWRNWFETRGERFGNFDKRFDPEFPLQPEIAELVSAPEGSEVTILDVGSGPLTYIGRRDPRWQLRLTAVDALGAQYQQLLAEFEMTPPVVPQACETEQLSAKFAAGSFDLVTARNTLDHSRDPVLAIRQMLHCAKPGSPLLLIHRCDEGERNNYRGMHQWNFRAAEGTVRIWRPDREIDLGQTLRGEATIERDWIVDGWEHIVIRKS